MGEIGPTRERSDQRPTGYAHAANQLRGRVGYRSLSVIIVGWGGAAGRIAYRTSAEVPGAGPEWTAAELSTLAVESGAGAGAPITEIERAGTVWAIVPIGERRPAAAFLFIDRGPSLASCEADLRELRAAADTMTGPVMEAELHGAREMVERERDRSRELSERLIEEGESRGWLESAHQELQQAFDLLAEQKQELEEAGRWNVAAHQELQNAFNELNEANKAKTRFLATVSHELKTPLTSISAFTDILSRSSAGTFGVRESGHLKVIQRNVHRLGLLINDLLDLSRIDAGTIVLKLDDFYLPDFLSDLSAMFAPILAERKQKLVVEDGSDNLWMTADRDRLEQMITNLLTNASKFSPDGAPIRMKIAVARDRLELTISDHGVGIPEEAQEHIFHAFYRVDNEETRAVPGTGVGLYTTASIVRLHGGEISVGSTPGHGTTFRAVLPGVIDGPTEEHMLREEARSNWQEEHRSRLEEENGKAA
ncbi:MAG: ATP-binding protein [Chloroflexi bacterium]|nr:ATP-binding protein [Chloroflexota bacterium]